MNVIWLRALAAWLALAVAGAVCAFFFGALAGVGLCLALLFLLALFNTLQTARFWRVLDAPVYGQVPSAPGAWGEMYYRLHRLTRRLHAQLREVEMQHDRFIEAMQASPNGVLMLDAHDRIEWCNANGGAHFGLDPKRDVGQYIGHLIRHPEFTRFMALEQRANELRLTHMGGRSQNVISVQVFPYGDNRKLVLSLDVTEVERIDAMRRDFVANVSHELKTPLTVLSGFIETVSELPLSPAERSRYLEIMAQQSQRMQNIVNDLLMLAQIEGDPKPPAEKRIDMKALIAQMHDNAERLSGGQHGIHVKFDESVALIGAEPEIVSAFDNLVTNAVRYTPAGGEITIEWTAEGSRAHFSVMDTGLGIPAEHIPRLTERFYRVDRSRSRDTGGTGLGLAIVKHVLQRHDAELQIRSVEGQGSIFSAIFPPQRVVRVENGAAQVMLSE